MTYPQRIANMLVKWSNACAKRNHKPGQEFYLNIKVTHVHHVITILTACVNHVH